MNYRGNCGFDAAETMQTLGPRIFSCTLTYYSNLSPAQPAAVKLGAGFGITTGEKQPLTCEYGLYATRGLHGLRSSIGPPRPHHSKSIQDSLRVNLKPRRTQEARETQQTPFSKS
jgi:hypothetical protein